MLEWDQKLSVGVENIDLQHRYFIDLIGRLSIELAGQDKDYQAKLIDELSGYTRQHFTAEENLMYKLGYPNLEEHRESHQNLLEKLHGQIGLYLLDMLEGEEIIAYLSTWLLKHILKEDRQLGQFIAEVKIK